MEEFETENFDEKILKFASKKMAKRKINDYFERKGDVKENEEEKTEKDGKEESEKHEKKIEKKIENEEKNEKKEKEDLKLENKNKKNVEINGKEEIQKNVKKINKNKNKNKIEKNKIDDNGENDVANRNNLLKMISTLRKEIFEMRKDSTVEGKNLLNQKMSSLNDFIAKINKWNYDL